MKIAIPTRNNVVDSHFGHCESYTVYQVDEHNQIVHTETVPSPQGCGCKSNIGAVLQQKGVSVLLAGNMGDGALNVLNRHGIKVYRGCSGDVMEVAKTYLAGGIGDSGLSCSHHGDDGHECQH
ncbi:putative Fe-Mo cluster-binding NifX family protein [Breznakibacter xylanolyticus]|uniref:Putative Fe-Mo cluster-binding NifX family protein n=1 Tax=Breznakibacter xylanolyticus TaxID=990 RepID=A0A2W7NB87_9BACT|nr:NifB/NifX family molybdenum-iron cluster-binding protein [Breznakibacter xylanolyticus]MBN2743565.1 NifB/NifX family molybdenum-iron cluster-binding protein [Marinilabiliaceae bacterium]PZX16903.1 putative Fe-Mo cluster-binding NifX family protein [Breznakibacter xylanolyticus]